MLMQRPHRGLPEQDELTLLSTADQDGTNIGCKESLMTGPANVAVLVNAGSTTIIEGAVEAVLLAFTVVVGVALERFLKDHSVVAEHKVSGMAT